MGAKFEGGSTADEIAPPDEQAQEKEDINYYYTPEEEAEVARTHTMITEGSFEFGKHNFVIGENALVTHTDYETPITKPDEVKEGYKFSVETPVKVLRAYQDKDGTVTHAVFEVLNMVSETVYTLTGRLMMLKTEDIKLKINLKSVANPIQINE